MKELDQAKVLQINREGWDVVAPRFYGAAALPNYGPLAPTEDTLGLLGDVRGKAVLELGCGSGHSLLYLAQHGASELWGIDLSTTQLGFAEALLKENNVSARLLHSPMEHNPGVPLGCFDAAISLYSLGWTTDLDGTLALVYSYLKPGGFYVFSWEHPFYSCIDYAPEAGAYVVKEPYREHTFVAPAWNKVPIVMHQRKLSTFMDAALGAGFQIERLVEGEANLALATDADYAPEGWYSVPRAKLVPPTFVMKLRKPRSFSVES